MFFSKDKNKIVDKKKELLGRDDSLNYKLFNEINGRDLMHTPEGYRDIILAFSIKLI